MKWIYVKKLEDIKSIQIIEERFDITFPQEFKEIVIKNNAGRPIPSSFDTDRVKGKDFGELLNFNPDQSFNILHIYDLIKDKLPSQVYPFAGDPGGNCLCYDFRKDKKNPIIRFWDHEMKYHIEGNRIIVSVNEYEPDNYNLDYVANDIQELLNNLYGDDEEDLIISPFSNNVLDIFINTYTKDELLELDNDTLVQIDKRLIERGMDPISQNSNKPYQTQQNKNNSQEE